MRSIALFALIIGFTGFSSACGNGGGTTATGGGGTPTPTPVPSGTPNPNAIGCRPYQVSQGVDGTGPTASYVSISALSGSDASEFLGAGGLTADGPLNLCGGQLSAGKAPLTLQQDVTIAVSLPQSNCACTQYLSAGTTGTLYCAASTDALDFTETLNSNNDAQPVPPQVQTDGPGAVAHAGDARIT